MRRRSLFTPLTAAAVAISLVSTTFLFAVVALTAMRESGRTLAATIDTDIAGLADVHLTGGADELRRRIEDRVALSQQQGERSFYMLAAPGGQKRAGNIDRWPELAAERSEMGEVDLDGGQRILARATQLSPDLQLVVGRSLEPRDMLLRRMVGGFLAAASIAALLSLAVGHLAVRRLRRRVGAINQALLRVEEGELERRAPGADRPDELGDLSSHANRTLDRIAELIAAHRNVSDQVAHEIRTPLMHLDAQLRTALDRTVDPQMVEWLGGARTEIRTIVQLLDSLLDIAGAEAMKGDLRGLGTIDLSDIAQSVADLYEDSADELGLAFDRRIAPAVAMRGDPMQMTRLLTNLLDNAFKYVPSGGRVRLLLESGPRIVVEDDGPGVAPAHRDRIFERYWRASHAAANGHGLGLALARAIAERHGFLIRVEDAAPGARFVVERGE